MTDTANPAEAPPAQHFRPVWAEVDLDAVRDNVRNLLAMALPAALLAVVKADGYGHGAVPVAEAALEAGATWLGVALVEEGIALRNAGIDAPVLVLSEQPAAAAPAIVAHRLTPIVYTTNGIDALAKAVADAGGSEPLPVHLKVDTGMHRVGCAPDDAPLSPMPWRAHGARARRRVHALCGCRRPRAPLDERADPNVRVGARSVG